MAGIRAELGVDYFQLQNHEFLDEMLEMDKTWLSGAYAVVPFFLSGGTLRDVSDGLLENATGFRPPEQLRRNLENFAKVLSTHDVPRFELITSVGKSIASDFESVVTDFSDIGLEVESRVGVDEIMPSLWVFCAESA